jgi:hypothetical protein
MAKLLNLVLGAVATAMVTIGVAAQTGTVRWPAVSESPSTGAVQAQQATEIPSPEPSPSPSLQPSLAPAAAPTSQAQPAPQVQAPPPARKKHKS